MMPTDIYMQSLPCAYARECPYYESYDDLYSLSKKFRVSYRGKKYEIESHGYGIDKYDTYNLYEDAHKKLNEWSTHQMRMDNIDAFYMIFGTPMGGDVGTKEFHDMCWQFIECLYPEIAYQIQR